MVTDLPRVNISVNDRVMLHLLEHQKQFDRYMVTAALTRKGISESCALHLPNVSRAMKSLLKKGHLEEHTRAILGEERRQKTWQLSPSGLDLAEEIKAKAKQMEVLIRDESGTLLEVKADQVSNRLNADLSLLDVLMHAQHEGVLTYGDIRFGPIKQRKAGERPPPGRLTLLAGAHATYHFQPPNNRDVLGREKEWDTLENWYEDRTPSVVIDGIAGIGKSTLVADWLRNQMDKNVNLSVCWYPCQVWDKDLGLAVSLLHRFGIDDEHDPYHLIDTLPLTPGADFDIDAWRRRLLAYLTDAKVIRERFNDNSGGPPPYWLLVLDDVHHILPESRLLLSTLLDIATKAPLRLMMISRTKLDIYDRRDVHVRGLVHEMSLKGLSISAIESWVENLEVKPSLTPESIHEATGGHPLALELMEMYGLETHHDWFRFLDEEIINVLPEMEKELLATLAHATKPIPWSDLARACQWDGPPPKALIEHGLLTERADGMWIHEALKERLLREVGTPATERGNKLEHV
ncbi:MAG TPA: hypothetical protein D7H86_07575 [Candidatus Poseidoniales archaeon]|nr:MAG TPA: hypothetical protein D7H86_07575 [Candidatus Poseidoniales archaeon]